MLFLEVQRAYKVLPNLKKKRYDKMIIREKYSNTWWFIFRLYKETAIRFLVSINS